MLHQLPITNVRISACREDWARMPSTEQGRHCARCNREVVDFTHASHATLTQARATAADGRLCGRFRVKQLAPESRPPRLQPKLRLFLAALVLVCVQGLSAQQAWAQVQKQGSARLAPQGKQTAVVPHDEAFFLGTVVEQMPEFRGGQEAFVRFLKTNLRYPDAATQQGKVFIGFTVQASGQVTDATVVKGLEPMLDAEALRVVRMMPPWIPASQNEQPVSVRYTLPISFSRQAVSAPASR
ncbi:energy transducer TonB [Hymenobacter koreensis]|uniref:TonB C-terminal domain-containing protein n=1 Tax=Hymenobacter koreensis TaxID=1084523 RepID=A0ABP8JJJ7_9BACT